MTRRRYGHDSSYMYDAFISYNHNENDLARARALRRRLHTIARPWWRVKAMSVYLDEENTAAGQPLTESVTRALTQSKCFVLLASVGSAESEWVRKEIGLWRRHNGSDRLLIGLVNGDLSWIPSSSSFASSAGVLPAEMNGAFATEPIWADLRNLDRAKFKREATKIAAGIYGDYPENVTGQDVRQRNRRVSVVVAAIVAIVALFASIVTTLGKLGDQTTQTHASQVESAARALLLKSEALRSTAPADALKFAVASLQLHSTPQARASLVQTMLTTRYRGSLAAGAKGLKAVAFGSSGKTVLAGGMDNLVQLYQRDANGAWQERSRGGGHTAAIEAVALSGDEKLAITGSYDKSAILWRIADGALSPVATLRGTTYDVVAVDLTDDGRIAVVGGRALGRFAPNQEGVVAIWDVGNPAHPKRLALLTADLASGGVVSLSPDGRSIVLGGPAANGVSLWSLADPAHPHRVASVLSDRPVEYVAVSHDGKTIVTGEAAAAGSDGGQLTAWAVTPSPSLAKVVSWQAPLGGDGLALSRDGDLLVVPGGDGSATVWALKDGSPPAFAERLAGHVGGFGAASISDDRRTVLTLGSDGVSALWDLDDGDHPYRVDLPMAGTDPVSAIAINHAGTMILAASDASVSLWRANHMSDATKLADLRSQGPPIAAAAFSDDDRLALTVDEQGELLAWDVSQPEHPFPAAASSVDFFGQPVYAFNRSATSVASPGRYAVQVADIDASGSASPRGGPAEEDTYLMSVAVSDDGTWALGGDRGGRIALWRLDSGRPVEVSSGTHHRFMVLAVAFAPNARTALSGGQDGTVVLWGIDASHRLVALSTSDRRPAVIRWVGYAPKTPVAVGSDEDAIRLWDVSDPSRLTLLATLSDGARVGPVMFTPDERWLVAGGARPSAWDLGRLVDVVADPVAAACRTVGSGLSQAEWSAVAPGVNYRPTC